MIFGFRIQMEVIERTVYLGMIWVDWVEKGVGIIWHQPPTEIIVNLLRVGYTFSK